jgi:hypothetical protein
MTPAFDDSPIPTFPVPGERGPTGDPGATGPAGADGVDYLSQENTASIRQLTHDQCVIVATNADSFNSIIDETLESVRKSTTLTDVEKADRIRRYEAVKQVKPNCGGK